MNYRFSKINDELHVVGGIVYAPDEVDADGDWTTSEEIYKGMESWMLSGHALKINHGGVAHDCTVIECFQAEADTRKGGSVIPAGAWYAAVKVHDRELWKAIKKGDGPTGFSMAGRAETVEE